MPALRTSISFFDSRHVIICWTHEEEKVRAAMQQVKDVRAAALIQFQPEIAAARQTLYSRDMFNHIMEIGAARR